MKIVLIITVLIIEISTSLDQHIGPMPGRDGLAIFSNAVHRASVDHSGHELWRGALPVADGLEVLMSISITACGCIEIRVNATEPPLYLKSYLYHEASPTVPFTYSKSLDFMTEADDVNTVGVPEDGEYVLEVHGLFELRQGWAPQGATREIMERVFDIPLLLNLTTSDGMVCNREPSTFWYNGEWCPSLCQGRAEALLADAVPALGPAAHWDLAARADRASAEAYERFSRVGRILLVGTSRMRAVFYELAALLGLAPLVEGMWTKANHDLEAGGRVFFHWDRCDFDAGVWLARFQEEYGPWCAAAEPWQPADVVLLSRGMCYTFFNPWGDRAELRAELGEERRRLDALAPRCRPPHRLALAREAGIHAERGKRDEFRGRSAFNAARLALVNHEMLALYRAHGLPDLDLFDPTASFFPNHGSEPYAHYYTAEGLRGNAASRAAALLVLDFIAAG
jgi:hypothetical protein